MAGDTMNNYFCAQLLTITLTIYGMAGSGRPCGLLCVMGLLLTVFTAESLLDETNVLLKLAKLVLILAFCACSRGFLMFLLWGEAKDRRYCPLLVPAGFLLWQLSGIVRGLAMPAIIVARTLLLLALSAVIWLLQKLADRYRDDRRQMSLSMGRLALSELEEKKLNRSLLMQSAIAERNARLEERENISRSIHNSVGHTITAASVALDAAEVLWEADADRALKKVQTANERMKQGLASIRHAVRVLDDEAERITIDDFLLELSVIADKFMMDTDCQVHWDLEILAPELTIVHEHTEFLTGAVEELLSNGVRHGHANHFTLHLLADSGHMKLTVTDNGAGDFDEHNAYSRIQNGFGLRKILHYVERNGGAASFANEDGFRAVISLPLEPEL